MSEIENLKSISKELKNVILDRFKHPLIFSFLIAFIFTNWKAILFFLVDDKYYITQRIALACDKTNCLTLFWIPLICAFIYTMLLPWLSHKIDIVMNPLHHKLINAEVAKFKYRDNLMKIEKINLLEDENRKLNTEIVQLNEQLLQSYNDVNKLSQTVLEVKSSFDNQQLTLKEKLDYNIRFFLTKASYEGTEVATNINDIIVSGRQYKIDDNVRFLYNDVEERFYDA